MTIEELLKLIFIEEKADPENASGKLFRGVFRAVEGGPAIPVTDWYYSPEFVMVKAEENLRAGILDNLKRTQGEEVDLLDDLKEGFDGMTDKAGTLAKAAAGLVGAGLMGLGGGLKDIFRDTFYYGRIGFIYYGVIICLVIWFVFNYIMSYTATGRHIYAIGSNVDAARLSGVDVYKTTTIAYTISAFCSYMAGLITMAAAGMGSMQAGMSYEMYGVAAAVIGGISTLGGTGLLVGVIAGASVWAILQNGLTMADVPVAMRNIIIGIIVVACVLFDIMRRQGLIGKKKSA